MKFFFLFFITLSFSLRAEDCETQNFITEENSPFAQIPTMNQAGSSLCYAAASTVLLNYELIKKGDQDRVNVLWTATRYAQRAGYSNLDSGGMPETAMEETMKANCDGSIVSSEIRKYAQRTNATEFEIIGIFDKFATFAEERRKDVGSLNDADVASVLNATQRDQAMFCGQVNWPELRSILKPLAQLTSMELFSKLMFTNCTEPKPILSDMKVERLVFKSDSEVLPTIETILDKKKGPIAISVCKSALSNPSYKNPGFDDCDLHSVVVAGKKMIGGVCHFLIRDSKGTRANKYSRPWKCLCKNRQGQFIDDCNQAAQQAPGVTIEGCWVSGNTLSTTVSDTQYLSPR